MTGESPSEMLDRLCAEHPGWEIRAHPLGLGLWTAEHRSDDGRSIHYIVCHTGDELDARMAEQAREQADRLAGRAMDVIDWAVSEGRLPG